MDDIIARLWREIDDLEFYRAGLEQNFLKTKNDYDKAFLACDNKIRRHIKELEEILRKES